MIRDFLFVLGDLAAELVDTPCVCRIHTRLDRIGIERAAAQMNGRFGLVQQLFHREHAVNVRHDVEMPAELAKFRVDIVAQRGRDVDVVASDGQLHDLLLLHVTCQPTKLPRFRSLDDGILIASRYLATVRRATLMPSSDSRRVISLSLSGLSGLSALTSLRIFARTAVEDCSPSSPVT